MITWECHHFQEGKSLKFFSSFLLVFACFLSRLLADSLSYLLEKWPIKMGKLQNIDRLLLVLQRRMG